MQQVNVILDPMQKSAEAKTLETSLRALVIGQDEAIEQVVDASMKRMRLDWSLPVARSEISCSSDPRDLEKPEW